MQMPKLIDVHCHLDLEPFDEDRELVLERSVDNNISDIIIPGTQKIYWDKIRNLCTKHKQLHACYGLHPYWVNNHNKQDLKLLDTYIELYRPVAIGECGLDFRPQQADKDTQLNFFENQLLIAENHNLPVVIHSVKATEKVIEIIRKFKNLTGMIHSYSGSLEQAHQLIDLNFFISASGSVTYGRAKKMQSVMKEIPLTSLLLETDAPDQPDEKNSDKRNEPAYLVNTARFIAELRGDSFENIARQTTMNAEKLFGI